MKIIMKEIIRQEMKNKPLGPFFETEQRKGNTLANCFEGYIDEFTLQSLARRNENFPIYPDNNSTEEMFDKVFDNYCDAILEVLTELYPEHKEVWAQHFEEEEV